MPKSLAKTPVTLLIDDQGAGLYLESGQFLGLMPAADPVLGLRAAWIPALRELVAAGTEVQLLLDQSGLLVQCQEAPSLNAREIRDVAIRVFAAETGAEDLECAGAQDADPLAGGGQVLWLAAQPRGEMHEWIGAIQGAGLVPAWAMPFQRALLQGLDSLWDTGPVRLVLAVTPSRVGHLCFFQGRSLALQRSFAFPADGTEAEELAYEEVSRLLQFIKQKNRELSFHSLEVLGLPPFSAGFQARVRSALGM